MKQATKEVYYCDYCKKKTFIKSIMVKHEANCYGNDANRPACFACTHLESKYIDSAVGTDNESRQSAPFCTLYNKQVHTAKAITKGLLEKYPEHFQESELMPMTCNGLKLPIKNDDFSM